MHVTSKLLILGTLSLAACGERLTTIRYTEPRADLSDSLPKMEFTLVDATAAECPAGGSSFVSYLDLDGNSTLDETDDIKSRTKICNGVAGTEGSDGSDGTNGADGEAARLSVRNANLSECTSGGAVYTSAAGNSSTEEVTVICNGVNGQNGSNGEDAKYSIGPVGEMIKGKAYSACHHDYLYFPNKEDPSRGWLSFRHQANGSQDQGIGSTGFQIWNVDIESFALVSEVGGVTYCTLNYNAEKRLLSYEVIDETDEQGGAKGEIQL